MTNFDEFMKEIFTEQEIEEIHQNAIILAGLYDSDGNYSVRMIDALNKKITNTKLTLKEKALLSDVIEMGNVGLFIDYSSERGDNQVLQSLYRKGFCIPFYNDDTTKYFFLNDEIMLEYK